MLLRLLQYRLGLMTRKKSTTEMILVGLKKVVDGVGTTTEIGGVSRDDMRMYVGDGLTGLDAILDGDIDGPGVEDALDHPRDRLHRLEQVADLRLRQIADPGHHPSWAYQYVSRHERLEVHQCKGLRRPMEDLRANVERGEIYRHFL